MKRLLLLTLTLFVATFLHATHNIAGEITVRCVGGLTYEVTVNTYTNMLSPADRCELTVDWGDGIQTVISRTNGSPFGSCPHGGIEQVPQYPNIKMNIYQGQHTYFGPSGPGGYNVSISDPNRVAGIVNIPNSVNVPFYLQTNIIVDPTIGCNSTPTLTSLPLDKACLGHCFYHNPGAVDPDNDSLSFSIGQCLDTNGQVIAGYTLPANAGGGTMTIDPVTGDLSWCSPQQPGKYNLIVQIDEWHHFPSGYYKIGTVLRDMNIEVIANCNNNNPDIPDLQDLCVDAGQSVNFSFPVTDPDADNVTLTGFGGPFTTTPPSTLTQTGTPLPTPFSPQPVFNWNTNCNEVRLQPWTVTFKARDDNQVPLTDIESVNITVVSPGPAFLNVNPQGSTMHLDWGQNPCDPVTNFCKGYKIFRRQGPSGWNPSQCETGVPAYTGFVQIGTVSGITNTTFIDNNGGVGLIPGVDYCYRVCAYFNDGAESYASPENCSELKRDVPVITNVDVMNTGSSNQIFVRWINALANGIDFDTIAHPGPYSLELQRCTGLNFVAANATIVTTFTVNGFYQLPSSYTDNSLNTAGTAYSYRLVFAAGGGTDPIGNCQPASSVFLTTTPSDNTVTLSWQYVVPWTNYEFAIYRQNHITLAWDSIALANGNTYVDDSLFNDTTYCYFVTAHGSYFNPTLPPVMYNRSQESCATPVDLTPPCAPQLTVNSNCYQGLNQLFWTNPMNMNCGTDDVVLYHIWYSAVEGDPLTLIGTISNPSDTTISYTNLFSVAGCYAITALDTFGNESANSNIVCVDNCPTYELPNVFTPNGDGTNDLFIPFPYRNVKDVDIKIYDRWGTLVYETTNPDVNWDGRDMKSGKLCTDGVYYYTCVVNEVRLQGVVPRELKGFVHLFGKDIGQFH